MLGDPLGADRSQIDTRIIAGPAEGEEHSGNDPHDRETTQRDPRGNGTMHEPILTDPPAAL